MNVDDKYAVKDLQIQLKTIQEKRAKLEDELTNLKAQEAEILKKMSGMTNEKDEEDMLARVYAQRRNTK